MQLHVSNTFFSQSTRCKTFFGPARFVNKPKNERVSARWEPRRRIVIPISTKYSIVSGRSMMIRVWFSPIEFIGLQNANVCTHNYVKLHLDFCNGRGGRELRARAVLIVPDRPERSNPSFPRRFPPWEGEKEEEQEEEGGGRRVSGLLSYVVGSVESRRS